MTVGMQSSAPNPGDQFTAPVTSNSVTRTRLSRGIRYHDRVYSRNSLGELTISGHFAFTTQ